MRRKPKNIEQFVEFNTKNIREVLESDRIYTKTEFYILIRPFCKCHKYPVHLVAETLIKLMIIQEHPRRNESKYSLMPEKGFDSKQILEQKILETYEETAWLAKFKNQKNK